MCLCWLKSNVCFPGQIVWSRTTTKQVWTRKMVTKLSLFPWRDIFTLILILWSEEEETSWKIKSTIDIIAIFMWFQSLFDYNLYMIAFSIWLQSCFLILKNISRLATEVSNLKITRAREGMMGCELWSGGNNQLYPVSQ